MPRHNFFAALSLVAVIFFTSYSAQAQSPTYNTAEFVHDASALSAFEIASAKEALKRYEGQNVSIKQNIQVKHFANRMIKDHTAIASRLDAALAASNIGLTAEHVVDGDGQKKMDVLSSISKAEAFDEQYANMQKHVHEKLVTIYRNYAATGEDAALRAYAAEVLPTLEEHINHVRSDLKPTV